MAKFVDIKCPSTFDTHGDPTSLGTRWKKWRQGFDLYIIAAGITDNNQTKALLLHCGGEDLRELFDTLPEPDLPAETNVYKIACTKLDTYFLPRKNKRYERHVFRTCVQKDTNESIAQYVTRLRSLAKTCEFHDTDDEIVDQVIEKCNSRKLRKRLLKEHDLTLAKLCEIAAIIEAADHQAEQYKNTQPTDTIVNDESDNDEVNRISNRTHRIRFPKSSISRQTEKNQTCYRCGSKHHLANTCEVTKGKSCHACGKPGHFSNVCKSSQRQDKVRYVIADSSSSDDDFVFALTNTTQSNNPYPIQFNGHVINVLIDSGSNINLISADILKSLKQPLQVRPYNRNVYPYKSKVPIAVIGYVWATVESNNQNTSAKFVVVPSSDINILGYDTACALDLLRVGPNTDVVNQIEITNPRLHQMLSEYTDRFEGLGKLKDVELHIQTDPNVSPLVQKARRLPILMQKQVDDELDKLLDYHVIEPVESPPTWVNPLVIVPKKDSSSTSIRMCVDMRAANAAVIREPYQIPTLEELLHELNGCTVFTKLDLNKGYHQIALDTESRDLTAFATHRGIFRYTRLIFGMSSAAELYQREIEHALIGIPGVRNISDDIIIGGRNTEELLDRMNKVFQRLREKHLTINRRKCEFLKSELIYMGHKLSAEGVAPDKRKIQTIVDLKPPSNVKEMRSFLGMVTYCSKFLPNFATVTYPLRQLLRKDCTWNWSIEHQTAFDNLKSLLLSSDTLAYYNPNAYTEVVTDASPVGLGAVITQRQPDGTLRPISYASRSLSSVETRYSQIERESLAILFAIERFRMYLYGVKFTVKTDHKPLVTMFSSINKHLPPRIERWVMKLIPYNYNVEYQPGQHNSADFLSRSNPSPTTDKCHRLAEEYVGYVHNSQSPTAVTPYRIALEQNKDPKIHAVKLQVKSEHFIKTDLTKNFYPVRNQLTIFNDVLMINKKIIIPPSLQQEILQVAHEGHQGIVRTKQRLRTKVWWPSMNVAVEEFISSCHGCQVTADPERKTPVIMTEIPDAAWLLIGCDLCGPFPTGENLLVCVDYYSRYPEVEIIHKTNATNITQKLRKLFCRYGAPETIITDNGPQFRKNQVFKSLMKEFGVKHHKVTPYHPEANGEVERFNRTLKKTIQAAIADGKNWRTVLENFLLAYRTTPHATTGIAPAELMFGRMIKDKLPNYNNGTQKNSVKVRDRRRKQKIATYANQRNHAKAHQLKHGDTVLVADQTPHRNKFTPRWKSTPYSVSAVKGNAVFLQCGNKPTIVRNSAHVKPYRIRSHSHQKERGVITVSTESSTDDDFILPATTCHNREQQSGADTTTNEESDDQTIPYQESDSEEDLFIPEPKNKRIRKTPAHLTDYVMN